MTMVTLGLERELNEMAEDELRRDPTGPFGPPPGATPSGTSGKTANTHAGRTYREGPTSSAAPTTAMVPANALSDDRNLAMGIHLGTLGATLFSGGLLDIFIPAISYAVLKDRGGFLKEHIRQQLNFQLTLTVASVIAVLGMIVTLGLGVVVAVPALMVMLLVDVVASIKATIAASRGEHYRFPLSIEFIKGEQG